MRSDAAPPSLRLRLCLNPAWSSSMSSPTALEIRPCSILRNTLLVVLSKVIPLQLSGHVRSPFFGILAITPFLQSSGTWFHILLNKGSSQLSVLYSFDTDRNSAGISSIPGALLFFSSLRTSRISCLEGGPNRILRPKVVV